MEVIIIRFKCHLLHLRNISSSRTRECELMLLSGSRQSDVDFQILTSSTVFLMNNEATRPHSSSPRHSIYKAEAKATCNEAKTEAVLTLQ